MEGFELEEVKHSCPEVEHLCPEEYNTDCT
jgi:hypothetical protein